MRSFLDFKSIDEQINEVLTKDTSAGEFIDDFVKSDNPKFAGKSAAKRKQMALAAYYAKQRESVDESDASWAASQEKKKEDRLTDKDKGTLGKVHDLLAKEKKPMKKEAVLQRRGDDSIQEGACSECGCSTCKCSTKKEGITIGESSEDMDKSHIEQHLANKDINSSVSGKTVKVHSSNVAAAKRHLSKAGYDHQVVGGLNEESLEEISKDTLNSYVHKSFARGNEIHKQLDKQVDDVQSPEERAKLKAELSKRNTGVIRAAKKLRSEGIISFGDYLAEGSRSAWDVSHSADQASKLAKIKGGTSNSAGKDAHFKAGMAHHDAVLAHQAALKHAEKSGDHVAAGDHEEAIERHTAESKKHSKLSESVEQISEGVVHTKKYSWGKMKTIHQGSDFSIPLHPEQHKPIAKLKDGQEHHFKDETGKHWGAYRRGEHVHFISADHSGKYKTTVKHSSLHEEVEIYESTGDDLKRKAEAHLDKGDELSYHKGMVKYHGHMADVHYGTPKGDQHERSLEMHKQNVHELSEDSDYDKNFGPGTTNYSRIQHIQAQNKKHYDSLSPEEKAKHDKATAQAASDRKRKQDNQNFRDKLKSDSEKRKSNLGLNEKTEELDEISKQTLGRYVKHASRDQAHKSSLAQAYSQHDLGKTIDMDRIANRRKKGIDRAVDKLTKEDVELDESLKAGSTAIVTNKDHPLYKQSVQVLSKALGSHSGANNKTYGDKSHYVRTKDGKEHLVSANHLVKEDVEELDEISKKTLGNYIKKASYNATIHSATAKGIEDREGRYTPDSLHHDFKKQDRMKGIKTAVNKLTKEEAEQIDELSKGTLGSYANKSHDQLMKHNASVNFKQGRGDSDAFAYAHDKEAVRKTANRTAGLKTAIKKLAKEEAEEFMQTEAYDQLDELSKKTLGDYVKKASVDAGFKRRNDKNVISKAANKRYRGINKAVDKLTKESVLSYSDFLAKLVEGKADDIKDRLAADKEAKADRYEYDNKKSSNVTKVKGHSYGAGEEGEEHEDESKPEAVKRGRGRPAGKKSGARI